VPKMRTKSRALAPEYEIALPKRVTAETRRQGGSSGLQAAETRLQQAKGLQPRNTRNTFCVIMNLRSVVWL
jgi:hypothetical protein